MGKSKRIWRGKAGWLKLFAQQSSSGLSVSEFCRQERINAGLFRRWHARLKDSETERRVTGRSDSVPEVTAPFIDLGDLRCGGPRFEVRLDLGSGVVLSIARG
jgi:hypothetical protein